MRLHESNEGDHTKPELLTGPDRNPRELTASQASSPQPRRRKWKVEGDPPALPVTNAQIEEWKKILDAPGYDVSSFGRFRNRRTGRLLTVSTKSNGYCYVRLGRKPGWRMAARCVIKAFPYQSEGPPEVVCYRDGDRTNLRFDNLYWASHKSSDPKRRTFLDRFDTLCEENGISFSRGVEAQRIAVNLLKLASPDDLQIHARHFFKTQRAYLRSSGIPPLRLFASKLQGYLPSANMALDMA